MHIFTAISVMMFNNLSGKSMDELNVVAHASNSSTWEVEADKYLVSSS